MADSRRAWLRTLIRHIERLPPSEQRDWMLAETRARISDLETGIAPGPMRAFGPDPSGAPA